ncbi:MAG: B12-binding domain-containing radical SAM protein, partial [Elusimicrobiales bacterium]
MGKNIVLIQPVIGDMDMFRDHPTPPIGLLAAASVVCSELEVRIVDQRADRGWRKSLAKALDADTVAVGVTAMTGKMITRAMDALQEARRHSRAPIVWGGLHASLLPEQTAVHELADFVIEGEGEEALAELVRRLAARKDTGGIPGVWRKVNGKIEHTPRAGLLEMDALPPIPYHLVDMERYIQLYDGGKRTLFYQSSRGC